MTDECSQEQKEEGTEIEKKEDSDEWATVRKVSRRRRPQRGRNRHPHTIDTSLKLPSRNNKSSTLGNSSSVYSLALSSDNNDSVTNEEIFSTLDVCLRELKESEYWRNLKLVLLKTRLYDIQSIVCYGIGNFGTKRPSAPLWQLALAVTIRDYIRIHNDKELGEDHILSSSVGLTPTNTHTSNGNDHQQLVTMYYFEPLMTAEESNVLEKLDIRIISENERGRRSVISEGGCCLFFMPHCPMTLYTNLLHTNWDCLRENILMFGNSLSNYIGNSNNDLANNPQKQRALEILKHLQPYWEEERLDISKRDISDRPAYFERAFNDSSLTCFRTIDTSTSSTVISRWPERMPQLGIPYDFDDGGEVV
mmetsp:Transcript_63749/g.72127  ORF Transcript_63749/g.72127 Transcript_63749/m.72127 type:complete len:364 (-) Transcript_63749:19-1110(-)